MSEYPRASKKSSVSMWLVVLVALALVAAAFWLLKSEKQTQPAQIVAPVIAPVVAPGVEEQQAAVPAYEPPAPVVEVEPLPALNESDEGVLAKLGAMSGDRLLKLMVSPELIRKFVMAVNAASEGKVVNEYRPIVSPPPPFLTETYQVEIAGELADQERVSPRNFARYEPYVTALALLDTDAAVATYKHFYPLLEEAYKELGLKKGNFHSVLIAAIDNLLAAPRVDGDILLIHPKVFYQFADPALEAMPQTHRLMVRMGPENERSVKASLRQLRAKLLAQ